jgi:hypothetical protein
VALALLARVCRAADGAPLDVATLPISDVDVLLLRLRQRIMGDIISAEEFCPGPDCHARVDITFSIGAYLEHHLPASMPGVLPAKDEGWYRLGDDDVVFRLPCAADQLAIARAPEPEEALLRRCVRPAEISEDARRRVEEAMQAMSPSLYSELEGKCPECGAIVESDFDPVQYTLRELRNQAAFVYEEVCSIAHHYHWSEAEILALPTARRARYADLAAHFQQQRTTA